MPLILFPSNLFFFFFGRNQFFEEVHSMAKCLFSSNAADFKALSFIMSLLSFFFEYFFLKMAEIIWFVEQIRCNCFGFFFLSIVSFLKFFIFVLQFFKLKMNFFVWWVGKRWTLRLSQRFGFRLWRGEGWGNQRHRFFHFSRIYFALS